MATCQTNPDVLRNLIKSEDSSSLALYRGFSRFMLEDFQFHPDCIGRSVSQRKKLPTKVAAEMITVSRTDKLRLL
jgi:pyoverdine/dityrosine biosynthesis protein Dit1